MKTIKRSYSSDMRKEDDPTQLIKDFMYEHNINNYTINPDKSVNVYNNVSIYKDDLSDSKLPFKFGKVTGYFDCRECGLTTLEGSPKEVGGVFLCQYNQLSSLEGCPEEVRGSFNCSDNKLTSLEGCPKEVGGSFDCSHNKKQFTRKEVRQYCKVKGVVWVS